MHRWRNTTRKEHKETQQSWKIRSPFIDKAREVAVGGRIQIRPPIETRSLFHLNTQLFQVLFGLHTSATISAPDQPGTDNRTRKQTVDAHAEHTSGTI